MKKPTYLPTFFRAIQHAFLWKKMCFAQFCVILLLFFYTSSAFSQLSSGSFEDMKSEFYASKNPEKALEIATNYLAKAKKANDIAEISTAYELFVNHFSHTPTAISYTDSIILLTKNSKLENYPAKGYLLKGIQLYYQSKYNDALTNFALANNLALETNNIAQQISIKHYIGLLKNVSKEPEERAEALRIFEENIEFIRKNAYEKKDSEQYLKSLLALADSYNKNRVLDSAEVVHQRGIKASLQHHNQYLYPFFLTSYGVMSYYKENYTPAIDSLLKATRFLSNNEKALCSNYLYVYRCLKAQKKNKEGIAYLVKVDSIYEQKPKVIFQAKEAYEFLNTEYKASNDAEARLATIEKLLAVDDIITEQYQNLGKEIVQKYETPLMISEKEELLSEKEALINQLQDENFLSQRVVTILIIVSIILLAFIVYFSRRNRVYKRRFATLMEDYEQKKIQKEKEKTDSKEAAIDEKIKLAPSQEESIGLPQDIVDGILEKLEKFEDTHRFTKKNYTLTKLAKELDTNSTYLSKIINVTKGMNFAKYMNEIRIDYAITRLKEDKRFRSYTIKAIAQEVGFNNAQSFSIAFHKKTGINPSYFLKQLENQKID
ncbi:AraC-like DNA-binding protein [Kordia periserrulae]|uniref:AraC-like DNA-binding protein n=1 Tax=Kordia periserrulae TaxID=701523 RepID=A0A2T6BVT5_9FLAO|nr:helix-turn-helix domain-containing protein [Kordia periserrulae]PTX60182.1 AraC-like DNA-binding protein [Kordia periserrulae]